MSDIEYTLPPYSLEFDLWDEIKQADKPIVVYGMGNGADKLCDRLESLGVKVVDFFASDGFVRGHSFRGVRVKSFSEIKELYPDFLILLSFGSTREEVIALIDELDSSYDLRIPDMPIAGMDEYFDKDFYNINYNSIASAYESLSDVESKNCFASIVRFRLFGRLSDLLACSFGKLEKYSLFKGFEVSRILDLGAYSGDTVAEFIGVFDSVREIVAVEPDKKTYKRLLKNIEGIECANVRAINAAVYSFSGEGEILSSGNRNSTVTATASYEHSVGLVPFVTVDSLDFTPDYIKMDVEGAEYDALVGAERTIKKYAPILLVSVYHRSRDIFFITNYLKEKYPFYKIYMRRTRSVPAWEIELILIPEP